MNIAIACASLCDSRGGTERALSALANEMVRRGHTCVVLFTPQIKHAMPIYPLDERVLHKSCPLNGKHADLKETQEYLLDHSIDVFLSMESSAFHLYWAVVCMGSGIPFIYSERCNPAVIEKEFWNEAGRLAVLNGADAIHELLPDYGQYTPEHLQDRLCCIPNAAPFEMACEAVTQRPNGRQNLLYLARFAEQKRPDLLIDAFNILASEFPDWDLHMWGHGEKEASLHRLISKHGLQNRIFMRGEAKDVSAIYRQANIYCLPSTFEGFPNTVLEAFCHGLPVVGFSCCEGVSALVKDNITGLLGKVTSAESLADALRPLMASQTLREAMGANALCAAKKYTPQKVFDQWEKLFQDMQKYKGNTAMDALREEPFASQATLSATARREWLFRDFGMPMPYSIAWWTDRLRNFVCNGLKALHEKIR